MIEPRAPIALATLDDAKFVDHLARKNSEAVGFLPHIARDWYLENGHVRMVFENGAPAGYLLGREKLRWCPAIRPIYQAAISFDAQRRHLGLALVEHVTNEARAAKQMAVQCHCAATLPANEFWLAAGFKKIGTLTPGNARAREIICWRKILVNRFPVELAMMAPVAGHRARRTR